jgi:hypothetical protein
MSGLINKIKHAGHHDNEQSAHTPAHTTSHTNVATTTVGTTNVNQSTIVEYVPFSFSFIKHDHLHSLY